MLIALFSPGKSKLRGNKKRSRLELVVYNSKENSKGEPIKYKKLNNNNTKLGKYNKWS